MNHENPKLILVRGLPGSGKSFLCQALEDELGNDLVVILDPDSIDQNSEKYINFSKKLSAEAVEEKFHPYRFLRQKAYEGIIAGKIIIWNQAFTNLEMFGKLVLSLKNYADENDKTLQVLVVEVEIDSTIAKKRIAERVTQGGHDVPQDRFDKFVDEYFSFDESGYQVVKVNGASDVKENVNLIKIEISKL